MSRDPEPTCPDCEPDGRRPPRVPRVALDHGGGRRLRRGAVGRPAGRRRPEPEVGRRDRRQGLLRHAHRRSRRRPSASTGTTSTRNAGCCGTHVSNFWHVTKPMLTERLLHQGPAGDPLRHLQGHVQSRLARAVRQAAQGRSRRQAVGRRAELRDLRQAGHGPVRVRHDRPAHDHPGRREQRAPTSPSAGRSSTATRRPGYTEKVHHPATSSGTRRSWRTRSTRSSAASSRSRPWSSIGPRTSSRCAFQGQREDARGAAVFGDVEGPEGGGAEGARRA